MREQHKWTHQLGNGESERELCVTACVPVNSCWGHLFKRLMLLQPCLMSKCHADFQIRKTHNESTHYETLHIQLTDRRKQMRGTLKLCITGVHAYRLRLTSSHMSVKVEVWMLDGQLSADQKLGTRREGWRGMGWNWGPPTLSRQGDLASIIHKRTMGAHTRRG